MVLLKKEQGGVDRTWVLNMDDPRLNSTPYYYCDSGQVT